MIKMNNKEKTKLFDVKSEGVYISDVGYIKSSIDRIENLDNLEEQYDDLHSRIIKKEKS